MIIIDSNNLAIAQYDEAKKLIVFKTHSYLANKNTNLIQDLLQSALKIAEVKPVIGEVVDIRQLRGNFTKIIQYLSEVYYPQMAELGMKKAAYIVSEDFLSRNLVEKIAMETTTVEAMAFNDYNAAVNWVVSQ